MLFFDDDLDSEIDSEINIDEKRREIDEKNEIAEKEDIKDKDSKILIRRTGVNKKRTGENKNKKKQKYILAAISLIGLLLFFSIFFNFGFFDKFKAFFDLNNGALHISEGKENISSKNDEANESSAAVKEEAGFTVGDQEAIEGSNGDLTDVNNSKDFEVNKDDSAEKENDRENKKDDMAQDKINNINNENNNSGLLYSISEISDPFFVGEDETTAAEAGNNEAEGSAEEKNGFQSAAKILIDNADEEVNGSLIESEEDIIQDPEHPIDQDSSSDIENTASTKTLVNSKDNRDNVDGKTDTEDNEVFVNSAGAQVKGNNKNINIENENQAENEAGVEGKDEAKSSENIDKEDKNKEVKKVELKIPFALRGTIVNENQAEALFFHNNALISRKVGEEIESFKILEITKKEVLISFMDFEHKMHIWGHDKVEAAE